eukprot:12427674-Karenia_brevis.AAC.1
MHSLSVMCHALNMPDGTGMEVPPRAQPRPAPKPTRPVPTWHGNPSERDAALRILATDTQLLDR